jgi:hypothetical protein
MSIISPNKFKEGGAETINTYKIRIFISATNMCPLFAISTLDPLFLACVIILNRKFPYLAHPLQTNRYHEQFYFF